jgi:hypothetical protein
MKLDSHDDLPIKQRIMILRLLEVAARAHGEAARTEAMRAVVADIEAELAARH